MFAQLRVLPIPSGHPYPRSLRRSDGSPSVVRHLADPKVYGVPEGQWWPPPALDPEWVDRHRDEVDLVHLHFGFDASSPEELVRWSDALDLHRIPLVLTVHDLVNPHFTDQRVHLERLDALVPRAGHVITLTPTAARRIAERWGRQATVLPHPHIVPLDELDLPSGRDPSRFVVGLHLKSLRANVVATQLIPSLIAALDGLIGAVLAVHLHREVLDPDHPRHDPELVAVLTEGAASGVLDLTLHDLHSDDQLWSYLRSLDLSVLPYAFGTHSGWVEACHDLGTAVLAPRTGLWTEQQDCHTFGWPPGGAPDDADIRRAVLDAYDSRTPLQATREERDRQQREVAVAHEQIYRSVVRDTTARWTDTEPA